MNQRQWKVLPRQILMLPREKAPGHPRCVGYDSIRCPPDMLTESLAFGIGSIFRRSEKSGTRKCVRYNRVCATELLFVYMMPMKISPGFYLTFWQLSMYDLAPPTARYAEEGTTLRALSRQEDSKYISADRSSDRAKRSTATIHRQRRDRYNSYANLLAEELKEQSASRSFTIKRLSREKLHWFSHGGYDLVVRYYQY